MRVVILGAGRMGSGIGACMKRAGDEVYLVDTYKDHIDRINEKGLDWRINEGDVVNVKFDGAFIEPNGLAACDVVILLTSGVYTDAVISNATRSSSLSSTLQVPQMQPSQSERRLQSFCRPEQALWKRSSPPWLWEPCWRSKIRRLRDEQIFSQNG